MYEKWREIVVETNPTTSLITGRNGCFKIAQMRVWIDDRNLVFIDGIGFRGKTINCGLIVERSTMDKIAEKWLKLRKIKGKL